MADGGHGIEDESNVLKHIFFLTSARLTSIYESRCDF
jgi:hypothetical protein